jgi:1-acyl-sn-glycerol-3-phosphate acyltransferase
MRRVADWILTLPFLVAFGAILLVFDPAQRVARRLGRRPQEIVAGWLQISLVASFRLTGMRLSVDRSPAVRDGESYLFVANHQSMFDIPILGALLHANFPKYVSKRELARGLPSISYNLNHGGHALIDRDDRGGATRTIRELGAQVRERGVSAVIFPEGTRARHGELRRFRPAGTLALLDAAPEVPVVPVVIDESWRMLRHNLLPVPACVHVRVSIGEPIERHPDEDPKLLLSEVRQRIEKTLALWRSS